MSFKNKVDFHMHSDNSDDGYDPVMLMCEYAVSAGLRVAAITDHCECNRYFADRFDKSIRQSFFETRKGREAFKDRLILMAGIELGQPMQDLDAANDALNANEYDYVLGSLHCIKGEEDFWKINYKGRDIDDLFNRYLDEMYQMVRWNGFDSLSHITYPLRYIEGEHNYKVDIKKYTEKFVEIFKLLANNQKALEINTSGCRQEYGKLIPDLDLLKLYKSFGGRYITLGSDAHHASDIGKNIENGMELAKAAGFDYLTIFEQRVPMLVPIL